jgi:hypothetical protein
VVPITATLRLRTACQGIVCRYALSEIKARPANRQRAASEHRVAHCGRLHSRQDDENAAGESLCPRGILIVQRFVACACAGVLGYSQPPCIRCTRVRIHGGRHPACPDRYAACSLVGAVATEETEERKASSARSARGCPHANSLRTFRTLRSTSASPSSTNLAASCAAS